MRHGDRIAVYCLGVSVGATIFGAALPLKYPQSLFVVNGLWWGGLLFTGISLVFLFFEFVVRPTTESSPAHSEPANYQPIPERFVVGGVMVAALVALFIGTQAAVSEGPLSQTPLSEKLPGFSWYAAIRMEDVAALRRKYVFDFSAPEGSRVAFYLSASDRFTFSVTDIHGEPYPLEIPLGRDGIPLGQFVVLVCETGIASNYAFVRVVMNGRELRRRDLPFSVDLGSRQWKTNLGADANGQNSGAFEISEFGGLATSLTDDEIGKLTKNVRDYYKF
jgi:hypothetical protein